jgi:cytochrome c
MRHTCTNPRTTVTLAIFGGILCATLGIASSSQDAGRGQEKRCSGCHTLDRIKVGPPLRGVYSRKAGRAPQFPYSDAVVKSSIIWDEATLDRWLTDTESVIPGNEMPFRLNDPLDRRNIIAYLRQLSDR